jgi:hypothetical protein
MCPDIVGVRSTAFPALFKTLLSSFGIAVIRQKRRGMMAMTPISGRR